MFATGVMMLKDAFNAFFSSIQNWGSWIRGH